MNGIPFSGKNLKSIRLKAGFKSGRKFAAFLAERNVRLGHDELWHWEKGDTDPTLKKVLEVQQVLKPAKVFWQFGNPEYPGYQITSGESLKKLREALNLSRLEAQELSGVDQYTQRNLETGITSSGGRVSTWVALAKAYKVCFEFDSNFVNTLKTKPGMPRLKGKKQ